MTVIASLFYFTLTMQSWLFIGRTDAEPETPILWPPHAKSWLIGKDSDAGRDWGQDEKGMTEDEMAGRHHRLDGHEFEWTPGVGDGQGGLACCDSWGRKESDTTERLNWNELKQMSENFSCSSLVYYRQSVTSILDNWRFWVIKVLPLTGWHRECHLGRELAC